MYSFLIRMDFRWFTPLPINPDAQFSTYMDFRWFTPLLINPDVQFSKYMDFQWFNPLPINPDVQSPDPYGFPVIHLIIYYLLPITH